MPLSRGDAAVERAEHGTGGVVATGWVLCPLLPVSTARCAHCGGQWLGMEVTRDGGDLGQRCLGMEVTRDGGDMGWR